MIMINLKMSYNNVNKLFTHAPTRCHVAPAMGSSHNLIFFKNKMLVFEVGHNLFCFV